MFDSFPKSSESDGVGVLSPQLWRESNEKSHGKKNYRCLSPASKAEAVARGERELMEMINKMPESSYELTLRDLVEVNQDIQERMSDHNEKMNSETKQIRTKKKDGRAQESRNWGIRNQGFLLNMAFPINFGSKNSNKKNKKKKIDSCASSYSENRSRRRNNGSKTGDENCAGCLSFVRIGYFEM